MSKDRNLYGGIQASETRTLTIHTDHRVRCWTCGRLLFIKATRPWEIVCRCKTVCASPPGSAPLPITPPVEDRGLRRRQSQDAHRGMSESA